MIIASKKYDRIILSHNLRSKIKNMSLRYPLCEVAGFIAGEIKKNIIFSKHIVFGEVSGWKRHCFELKTDILHLIFNQNAINPNCIPCLFHAHPDGKLFPTVWDLKGMIFTKIPWLIYKSGYDYIKLKGYIFERGVIRKINITNC